MNIQYSSNSNTNLAGDKCSHALPISQEDTDMKESAGYDFISAASLEPEEPVEAPQQIIIYYCQFYSSNIIIILFIYLFHYYFVSFIYFILFPEKLIYSTGPMLIILITKMSHTNKDNLFTPSIVTGSCMSLVVFTVGCVCRCV